MTSTPAKIQQRLHELRDAYERLPTEQRTVMGEPVPGRRFTLDKMIGWTTEVRSVLEMVLPEGHTVLRQWDATYDEARARHWTDINDDPAASSLLAILDTAISLVDDGLLTNLKQGAKAETVDELLDVADDLLDNDHKVAAAVLAGGALETHLRHLCDHHGVALQRSGSISVYDGAIAQERKAGNAIYSGTDAKHVTAWGGMRNDAAHNPTTFDAGKDAVGRMVSGIRGFVARTTPGE